MSEKKGSNKLLVVMLIILIFVVVSVSGYFAYNIFIKPKVSSGNSKALKVMVEKTIALDDFVVNLADQNETKYLKTKVYLAYTDKNLDKEVAEKLPQIREMISVILGKKTTENFQVQYLNKIKKELTDNINTLLNEGKITNVYLNDFIIQ